MVSLTSEETDETHKDKGIKPKSNEGAVICGRDLLGPAGDRANPTTRLTTRLMNVEKMGLPTTG